MEPVESTPKPTAYEFNYWLINLTYLYEDELKNLPEHGDSIQELYQSLSDRYTRYYPPSKSEAAEQQMNTSVVEGDLGMEYMTVYTDIESGPSPYPILISRVYAESPAGRAGVPRYGRILYANGIELADENAKIVYDSIVDYSEVVSLDVFYNDSVYHFELTKETVYAPTVFLDTVSGITFVTITEFKGSTVDRDAGTYGELKAYLDSTAGEKSPRVLDLRNNPGGLISQCLPAADLFVKQGLLSERRFINPSPDGKRTHGSVKYNAKSGDSGEGKKFVMLANRASASCAEIFIAAVKEQGNIPLAGENTFGKGIGQSQWKTMEDGLAVITNLEFYTPKGNSYHNKGVEPDFMCETVSRSCAINAIETLYGNTAKASLTVVEQALLGDVPTISAAATKFNVGGAVDPEIHFVNYPHSP
jgi:C-terminal peptidase prc